MRRDASFVFIRRRSLESKRESSRCSQKSPPAELQSRRSDGPHGSRLGQLGEEAQRRGPGSWGDGGGLQLSSILRSMAVKLHCCGG